jgi:hypothetical protein
MTETSVCGFCAHFHIRLSSKEFRVGICKGSQEEKSRWSSGGAQIHLTFPEARNTWFGSLAKFLGTACHGVCAEAGGPTSVTLFHSVSYSLSTNSG